MRRKLAKLMYEIRSRKVKVEAVFLHLTEYRQYAILENIHILDSVEGEE